MAGGCVHACGARRARITIVASPASGARMLRSLHAVFPRLSLSAIAPVLVCCGLLLVCAAASAQTPPPSIVPTDRLQETWWAQRHAQVLEQVRQHPDTPLLLIGDSITQNYEKAKAPDEDFQPTWQTFYGSRGALNLGFSGDGTEHVLWRLANGEVDGLQPKVALVLIGTNNTGHLGQTAEQAQARHRCGGRGDRAEIAAHADPVGGRAAQRHLRREVAPRCADQPGPGGALRRQSARDLSGCGVDLPARWQAAHRAVLRHPLPSAGRCPASGHARSTHAGRGDRTDPGAPARRAAGQAGCTAGPRLCDLADSGRPAGAGFLRLVCTSPCGAG